METALVTYLLLGLGVGLWLYGTGLYHDWQKGEDSKLGFRWKSRSVIAVCVATALPVINIIFALMLSFDCMRNAWNNRAIDY
jgi:uncharacterized membrane-anchored protein